MVMKNVGIWLYRTVCILGTALSGILGFWGKTSVVLGIIGKLHTADSLATPNSDTRTMLKEFLYHIVTMPGWAYIIVFFISTTVIIARATSGVWKPVWDSYHLNAQRKNKNIGQYTIVPHNRDVLEHSEEDDGFVNRMFYGPIFHSWMNAKRSIREQRAAELAEQRQVNGRRLKEVGIALTDDLEIFIKDRKKGGRDIIQKHELIRGYDSSHWKSNNVPPELMDYDGQTISLYKARYQDRIVQAYTPLRAESVRFNERIDALVQKGPKTLRDIEDIANYLLALSGVGSMPG